MSADNRAPRTDTSERPATVVGTCDLLRFYTDRKRFPELDARGVAVIAALLMFVNTSGRGGARYRAHPSRETLALAARVSVPIVRKWTKYLNKAGWLLTTVRRAGNRNASNGYDVTPAVRCIAEQRPVLAVVDGGRHER